MSEIEGWNSQVTSFLAAYLKASPIYRAFIVSLWEKHLAAKLADRNFVRDFTSGTKEKFFQRVWEMMLARHLEAQGHALPYVGAGHPDFRFEHGGLTVWVEAIAPEPKGLPNDWLTAPAPNEFRVGNVPHTEILLRWTAAFDAKWRKLNEYRTRGIVRPSDAYVIAINGCQLGALPLDHGISRYPYVVEAVLPVGPLAIPIDRETRRMGSPHVSERFNIRNANGASVSTTPFIDPKYSGVSAVIGYGKDRYSEASLPAYIIHNPLADVRVLERILGAHAEEWLPDPIGAHDEHIEFKRLRQFSI